MGAWAPCCACVNRRGRGIALSFPTHVRVRSLSLRRHPRKGLFALLALCSPLQLLSTAAPSPSDPAATPPRFAPAGHRHPPGAAGPGRPPQPGPTAAGDRGADPQVVRPRREYVLGGCAVWRPVSLSVCVSVLELAASMRLVLRWRGGPAWGSHGMCRPEGELQRLFCTPGTLHPNVSGRGLRRGT